MITLSFISIILSGLFLVISALYLLYLIFQIVLLIFFWGAIYVPARDKTIQKTINLAQIKPADVAADLGSGDGRLVIALAKAGAEAHGYEINPFLVWLAKRKIDRAGLRGRAFIHWKNFWKEDFSKFDIVVVFGLTHMMKKLEIKFKKELKNNARIISIGFILPTWPHTKEDDGVYLYDRHHEP